MIAISPLVDIVFLLFVGHAGGQRRGCEPVDDLSPVLDEAIRNGRKHVQRDEYAWEYVSVFHWNPSVFECGLTFGIIF